MHDIYRDINSAVDAGNQVFRRQMGYMAYAGKETAMFGRKIEYNLYHRFDHTGMETHLEKMARKGWFLDEAGSFFHYYKGEPKTLKYAVGYYPDGTFYAPLSDEEISFEEFCSMEGWEEAASFGPIKIFYNENTEAVDLDTDPELQIENIKDSITAEHVVNWIMFVLGVILTIVLARSYIRHPLDFLAGEMSGPLLLLALSGVVLGVEYLCSYYPWLRKAKENAKEGRFTRTKGNLILAAVAIFLCLISVVLLGLNIGNWFGIGFFLIMMILYSILDRLRPWLKKRRTPWIVTVLIILIGSGTIGGLYGAFQDVLLSQSNEYEEDSDYFAKGFHWDLAEREVPIVLFDLEQEGSDVGLEYVSEIHENAIMSIMRVQCTIEGLLFNGDVFDRDNASYELPEDQAGLNYMIILDKVSFLHDTMVSHMKSEYQTKKDWVEMTEEEALSMGARAAYYTEKQREIADITYVDEDDLPVEGAAWDFDMNGDTYRKDPTGKMITVYRYILDFGDREICIEVNNPLTPEQGQRIAAIVNAQ